MMDIREPTSSCGVVLLIPALNPDERLLALLHGLDGLWTGPVLLVNDGSSRAAPEDIFERAAALGCVVVRHAVNLGKGRALKTGFNECLLRWPGLTGVITADADGQHLPADIAACARRLREMPDALVLGCRDFADPAVPSRNAAGNRFTRMFMRFCCGVSVTDTQTGLRGIPRAFMEDLLSVPGERFEFETNMLMEASRREIPFSEVPISTVYVENGRHSHFNPFRDSLRVLSVLIKYSLASLAGALVDYAGFIAFLPLFPPGPYQIAGATISARVLSSVVNFLLTRWVVFQSKKRAAGSAWRFGALCVLQALASAGLVTLAACALPAVPAVLLKIVVDTVLFFVSYYIQRRWIF